MNLTVIKEGKRTLIMEAAVQVFSRKGYHNSKMEEIAVEAGIGKGTIYEYFPGKLQLLQEIMEESFRLYDHSFKAGIANGASLQETIQALVEGHLRFCQENRDLTRIIFLETNGIDEELRNWAFQKRQQKERFLQKLFAEADHRGEIKAVDPRILTVIIGGIMSSLWVNVVAGGWNIDAADTARQVTEILMNGIKR